MASAQERVGVGVRAHFRRSACAQDALFKYLSSAVYSTGGSNLDFCFSLLFLGNFSMGFPFYPCSLLTTLLVLLLRPRCTRTRCARLPFTLRARRRRPRYFHFISLPAAVAAAAVRLRCRRRSLHLHQLRLSVVSCSRARTTAQFARSTALVATRAMTSAEQTQPARRAWPNRHAIPRPHLPPRRRRRRGSAP